MRIELRGGEGEGEGEDREAEGVATHRGEEEEEEEEDHTLRTIDLQSYALNLNVNGINEINGINGINRTNSTPTHPKDSTDMMEVRKRAGLRVTPLFQTHTRLHLTINLRCLPPPPHTYTPPLAFLSGLHTGREQRP